MGTRQLRHSKKYPLGSIGNMDETPLWLDMLGETTIAHTGDRANYYSRKLANFRVMRPRGRSKFISPDNMAGQSLTCFFEYSSASTSASSASTSCATSDKCNSSSICLQRNQKGKRKCLPSTNGDANYVNLEHKTLLWLRCDKDTTDKLLVSTLWCEVCQRWLYMRIS